MAAKKKSAAKKRAVTTSTAKKSSGRNSAAKAVSSARAAKKPAKKGKASATFAHAGAKVDQMLARGQKGIRTFQSKVVEIEEKSRAFLADASSSPAIKKIRSIAKKANRTRSGQRTASSAGARKDKGKANSKGKAAKVVSDELSKLSDTLKDVFKPHTSP